MKKIKTAIIFSITVFCIFFFVGVSSAATITLNPAITYQTWGAWMAHDYACDNPGDCPNMWPNDSIPSWINAAYTLAVDELGVTGLYGSAGPSIQNSINYWGNYKSGCDSAGYASAGCITAHNDNLAGLRGPGVGSTYYWDSVAWKFDRVITPFKSIVESRGLPFTLLWGQGGAGNSTYNWCQAGHESAYADHMVTIFQHLQNTYGYLPDYWDPLNEPDVGTVSTLCPSTSNYVTLLKAAGAALATNNINIKALVPNTENTPDTVSWFDAIWADSGTHSYIGGIGYHQYGISPYCTNGGTSCSYLISIGNRAFSNNIVSAMTEYMGGDYVSLHSNIKYANTSYWDGFYTLIGPSDRTNMTGCGYDTASENGRSWGNETQHWITADDCYFTGTQYHISSAAKFIRQYSKFIRPGAVRIAASSDSASFDPIAFINSGNSYAVVVKASSAGSFSVQGLPASTYGIKYTTASQYNIDLADAAITSGQILNTNIPAAGVITVYSKSQLPPDTQAPSVPSSLSATAVSTSQINLSWTASTDNIGVVGYRIYRCQGSGCTPSTQIGTTASVSYQDTGLTANTIYRYTVVAYDAAGNVSSQSSVAQATTMASGATTVRFYAGAGDGYVTYSTSGTTWTSVHDAASGSAVDYTGTVIRTSSDEFNTGVGNYNINRGFISFDTSGLPDNAAITAATLNLYITSNNNGDNDGNDFFVAVKTSQPSPVILTTADYDLCGNAITNPTEGSGRFDATGRGINQYWSWTLNSTGLGWIKKTVADPYTMLGLREGHDVLNDVIASDVGNQIRYSSSEQTGTAQDPYLEVTYTIGVDTTPPAAPTGVAVN